MENQAHEDALMAFEDFQRHSREERNEFEGGRWTFRQQALTVAQKAGRAYRHTIDGVIEPVFTIADHQFMRSARVFA